MSSATNTGAGRRAWADWVIIGLFGLLIGLPTADFFLGIDHTQAPGENRLPAPAPRLTQRSLAGLQNYVAASEAYFNDHFGFRKRLIRWYEQWKMRLYHDQSVNKVVIGQDHWLYTGEQQMVDHFLGLAQFTPAELATWRTLLEKRQAWLAHRGIRYLLVIPPDKQTIYPEHLPVWLLQAAPARRETKLDQLLGYLRTNSTVAFLDLRPVLLAAKPHAPVYLMNDTHWNLYGGFLACQAVVRQLGAWYPDLPPLRDADFQWTNTPVAGGDLAKMLDWTAVDNNHYAFTTGPALPVLSTNATDHFETKWGTKTLYTSENPALAGRTVVVFHDSYGGAWKNFLGYSFHRTVFEACGPDFNPGLIQSNAPAVVVSEMLERYAVIWDPGYIMQQDGLPGAP